jgi:hypothetical protein
LTTLSDAQLAKATWATGEQRIKPLNVVLIEEAHKADDLQRSNEIDPRLASTGGFSIYIGVDTTRKCDFKRGCDGDLPGVTIVVPATEVIADRRSQYEQDHSTKHLEHEKTFVRELRKKGHDNPETRRIFYLEDIVEEGNFVSRERLLSCARGPDILVPFDTLFLGLDWCRVSDQTIATISHDRNDVFEWFAYPADHPLTAAFEEQTTRLVREYKGDGE